MGGPGAAGDPGPQRDSRALDVPDHRAYNSTYYEPFKDIEAQARRELVAGRDHLYEAELKERRRTRGHPDHTTRPDAVGSLDE